MVKRWNRSSLPKVHVELPCPNSRPSKPKAERVDVQHFSLKEMNLPFCKGEAHVPEGNGNGQCRAEAG